MESGEVQVAGSDGKVFVVRMNVLVCFYFHQSSYRSTKKSWSNKASTATTLARTTSVFFCS